MNEYKLLIVSRTETCHHVVALHQVVVEFACKEPAEEAFAALVKAQPRDMQVYRLYRG